MGLVSTASVSIVKHDEDAKENIQGFLCPTLARQTSLQPHGPILQVGTSEKYIRAYRSPLLPPGRTDKLSMAGSD